MSHSYAMIALEGTQAGNEDSFIGGRPKLPPGSGVPDCGLCGTPETFFFQVAFPDDHSWAAFSVAVFSCTSCADENYLIPEMLSGPLHGADVPAMFLVGYQRNFRFYAFKTSTGKLLSSYREGVRFRPVRLAPGASSTLGQVGGEPDWILENESPGTIGSTPAVFLLQLSSGVEFETLAAAPRQVEIGLDGTPEASTDQSYRLFIGNTTYLFGSNEPATNQVYAVTQVE